MNSLNKRPFYIAIEGVKGTGKSSILPLLSRRLQRDRIRCHIVAPTKQGDIHEPIESIIAMHPELLKQDTWKERLYAYRSNYAAQSIPATAQLLLGDRSIATSYATRWHLYQNKQSLIERVDALEPLIPGPDCIVYLKLPHEELMKRLAHRTERNYGKEDETDIRIMQSLHAYDELRKRRPGKLRHTHWISVDTTGEIPRVANRVFRIIEQFMKHSTIMEKTR